MLKLVGIGIWVILVTAGATFASVYIATPQPASDAQRPDLGLEEVKADMTSIPIMRGGEVLGYLILQLSFAADRALLEARKTDPLPFMQDAAFRVVFGRTDIDFQQLKPQDIDTLAQDIAAKANSRLGVELVRQVLLQQVNFVRREDIRTNWISSGNGGN